MEENNNFCAICNKYYNNKINFCPICGEPLTDNAKNFLKQKEINAQLQILRALIKLIHNEKDLQIIKSMINKLTENN